MVIAVNNGNRQGHVTSLVVRQGDVAILGSCLLAVNRVFSLIVTLSTSNGHLNLCVVTNVECSSACGIEGDHDSVSSVEGVFSGLGGDAILIGTFVSIAVINVNRQGHVTSLVAGNVDALLGIVGRFGLAFKVSRVGDQHIVIVADSAVRSNFDIHYIAHGVGFSLGISSQRDADRSTCGEVEGNLLCGCTFVLIQVFDGYRQGNIANLVTREGHIALFVGFQSGLANHVGHVIFTEGASDVSCLNLHHITNGIVHLVGAQVERDGRKCGKGVSTTLLYNLSIRTAVKGGNCQGYSNSLVVGQGYIALGVGSQRLFLDIPINGVASYVFNIAFADSVLHSDFHLSLGANGVIAACGIQRNRQRLVVNVDGVGSFVGEVLIITLKRSSNDSRTGTNDSHFTSFGVNGGNSLLVAAVGDRRYTVRIDKCGLLKGLVTNSCSLYNRLLTIAQLSIYRHWSVLNFLIKLNSLLTSVSAGLEVAETFVVRCRIIAQVSTARNNHCIASIE